MDIVESLFYDINYLDYDSVAAKSVLNTHDDFFNQLMRRNKKELVATLINYSYICNNDKSTGTTLETAIAQVMGAKVDHKKKHGCDSFYENGNTLEIKPENVYYPEWNGHKFVPTSANRLNMLGKYNDFTWHGLIRYISGTETNSNDPGYRDEIMNFIDSHYVDEDYKTFMKVACYVFGKKSGYMREDSNWWKMVASQMDKDLPQDELEEEWNRIIQKVRLLEGSVKPNKWNKYHVAGGSVGGKLVYVARIDFPVVYEKLFFKLLECFPPETRFLPAKSRCQIDFTYTSLDDSNLDRVKWVYVDSNLHMFKDCFVKGFWDIIVSCNPDIIVEHSGEEEMSKFERLFSYE